MYQLIVIDLYPPSCQATNQLVYPPVTHPLEHNETIHW
jgi:hypothetical protein